MGLCSSYRHRRRGLRVAQYRDFFGRIPLRSGRRIVARDRGVAVSVFWRRADGGSSGRGPGSGDRPVRASGSAGDRQSQCPRNQSPSTVERSPNGAARSRHFTFRRLEARLGFDPDQIDERTIRNHLDDASELGDNAVEELAAHAAHLDMGTDMVSASELRRISVHHGFDARTDDAVRLQPRKQEWTASPAWQIGESAARAVRVQENLGSGPICNARLTELAGTTVSAIENGSRRFDKLSFVIAGDGRRSRLALRPKWHTGRRFDVARLIGDRLFDGTERLSPATQAYSYRQKAQRAFAAELLSPYEAVDDMLGADVSEERQAEAAEHFQVSPMTIWTQLVNKGRIGREHATDRLY